MDQDKNMIIILVLPFILFYVSKIVFKNNYFCIKFIKVWLTEGKPEIVKNFLPRTLDLQLSVKGIDRFTLEQGLSASFNFFILQHAYTRATGDYSLSHRLECHNGMKLILSVCLVEGFGTFPTLLCADGCCVTDRRMGVSGYPMEIQALFFMALRCAVHLLREDDGKEFSMRIEKRLQALTYHMRSYFWLDFQQLNNIYRYKTEEYSHTAVNKFNVMPNSIPDWVFDFMPMKGGYFVANSMAILDLIEDRWEELVGKMPLKLSYPALDIHGWSIETGSDPKNTRWSSQNGGSWPGESIVVAYCSLHQTGWPEIARKAIELAEHAADVQGRLARIL
ncbi:putative alkaline/neutral invertase F [Vitis vinifera]|uniref:Alkaline/neutral invertase n=1 Tax=Vitis vinifera TaxID=29760 RepID=A0A438I227_VITVI|nr:putative alkaline/neutral invertase F [Vitis vinifera]